MAAGGGKLAVQIHETDALVTGNSKIAGEFRRFVGDSLVACNASRRVPSSPATFSGLGCLLGPPRAYRCRPHSSRARLRRNYTNQTSETIESKSQEGKYHLSIKKINVRT
jgi:hypothetical protein